MFDNFFQMAYEFFLTLVWFVVTSIKDFFMRLFHRAHTFNMTEVIGHGGESARCQKCGKTLYECRPSPRRRMYTLATIAVLALAVLSRADSFVGSQRDTAFFRDSVYILKVSVTQSDCAPATPCTIQVASQGGSGTVFKNLYGASGDTISVPYNFPAGQFLGGATRVTLYFFGSDGKAKDIWMASLAYKDVKPPLGLRRHAAGFHAPGLTWTGLVNGRNFK